SAIHPGAVDIPDDGIDQNCDGFDATNLDRDHDGFLCLQDCDDMNASIHLGAFEVIGNMVDENCDGIVVPFLSLIGSVSGIWQQVGKRTRNLTLEAKGFLYGTEITLSCMGARACSKKMTQTVPHTH